MTAAQPRRWCVPSRLAHLALIASVLIGLAAMHGASSVVVSGGGHGPVWLPVAMDDVEAHPNADGAHGIVAHQLGELAGEAIATLSVSDMGSHHSLMVGCALALTGILTLALLWLVRCASERLVQRLGVSRAGPRLPDRLQRAGPGLVPRFSLCVLRT